MQAEQMFPLTAGLAQSQLLRGYQIPTSTTSSLTQPASQNSTGLSPLQSIAGLTGLLASPNWSGAANNLGKLFGGSGSVADKAQAAFSQTPLGSSGFGTGLAYGNQDFGDYF